jgi:uncharacterized membrane protein
VATLSALKFSTPTGADEMLAKLMQLQSQGLITVQDAAIVRWPNGAKKPKTQQLNNLAGTGALSGAFWGMLFGLLFFVPIFGMAIGAAFGALAGHWADVGISDNFIKQVKQQVTEGTSAIFLLTSGGVLDRIKEAVRGMDFEIISTNLSADEEAKLREAFAEDSPEMEPAAADQQVNP